MCGVSMDKRHTLKALQHKGLRHVWRLWRLFSTLEDLEEEAEVDSPFAGTGIPTNGDAEERTIILSEKRRG